MPEAIPLMPGAPSNAGLAPVAPCPALPPGIDPLIPGPAVIIAFPPGALLIPGALGMAEPATPSAGADIAGALEAVEPPAGAVDVPALLDAGSSLPPQPISAAAQQMRIPEKGHRSIGRN